MCLSAKASGYDRYLEIAMCNSVGNTIRLADCLGREFDRLCTTPGAKCVPLASLGIDFLVVTACGTRRSLGVVSIVKDINEAAVAR